jgi:hypothetical protein
MIPDILVSAVGHNWTSQPLSLNHALETSPFPYVYNHPVVVSTGSSSVVSINLNSKIFGNNSRNFHKAKLDFVMCGVICCIHTNEVMCRHYIKYGN